MPEQVNKKRRVLLCVTGLSPQIVTETVFALCTREVGPWVPDAVYLITTERGAENARLMLLSDEPGWFHRLRADWNLPPIEFDPSHIHTIRSADGSPLPDIRDDIDNQIAADAISDFVRRFASDEDCEIHASIAGGRKTMGFFLGYAMSLWGRPTDRLSHVLVSAPYENRAGFFYPTPKPSTIVGPGDPLDAAKARVWLGDIPFVRLRSLLPPALRKQGGGFAATVDAANYALSELKVVVRPVDGVVVINNQEVSLPPMQICILLLIAYASQQPDGALPAPSKEFDDAAWRESALKVLRIVLGTLQIPASVDDWLNSPEPPAQRFSQQLSKLERNLAQSAALPLRKLIARKQLQIGNRQRGYRIDTRPENIHILCAV